MKILLIVILFAVLLVLTVPVFAADEYSVTRDVVYGKSESGKALTMIVIEKPGSGDFQPACVAIHGGGWSAGRAEDFVDTCKSIANYGYKVFDIDYRLAPEARMSQQIADCRTAVRHIRANAKKYGINPNRIMAMGHSAGGHLSCMLAVLKPGIWEGAGCREVSSRVQGVLNLAGPEELIWYKKMMGEETAWNSFAALAEDKNGDPESEVLKLSPITYVTRACCPIVSIHGGVDDLVGTEQGENFHRVLTEKGVRNKLYIFPEEDHGLWVNPANLSGVLDIFLNDFKNDAGLFAPVKVKK